MDAKGHAASLGVATLTGLGTRTPVSSTCSFCQADSALGLSVCAPLHEMRHRIGVEIGQGVDRCGN